MDNTLCIPRTPQLESPSPHPGELVHQEPQPETESAPNPAQHNSLMTGSQIVEIFHNQQLPDVTTYFRGPDGDPVSLGSSGHLYHARCARGEAAIRTIRIFMAQTNSNQLLLKAAADELLVWLQLQHEFLTPLWGVACFREQAALVSPWMPYGNIIDYRRQQPYFDWQKMCTQVSSAVAYLHDNGVIHGDIKAQNVLVSEDGNAKVTGFSNSLLRELASHYRDGNDFSTLSMRWIAPEVLEGASARSEAVDVYALGMTILEIITGKVPFDEVSSDQGVIFQVITRTAPTRPQELASNDRLWALLTQCWSSDPKARPTAREVYDQLKDVA
ncbi:unnamed protein product [Rhizoctonia solani]|uniref:Protein kinase domain-containing protein n=1 Tax=Rhizoctonia solani TaxID=456999 RepID=A0A8H3HB04_9AGAM|nr:unnamed protein product [Rhizoctonia solani]